MKLYYLQMHFFDNFSGHAKKKFEACVWDWSIFRLEKLNLFTLVNKQAKFIFFADDTNIIVTGYNIDELQAKVSSLQSLLDNWVRNNGLKLNIKKTKFMILNNKNIDISGIEMILDNTKLK